MSGQTAPHHSPFPMMTGRTKGYSQEEVDQFLARVKDTYEHGAQAENPVTSAQIREQAFSLRKKGYDPRHVDAALDRLEEVLFERERRQQQQDIGVEQWKKELGQLERELAGRMNRAHGERFKRRSFLAAGYRISQVDAVIDQLADRLDQGKEVRVNDIRTVRFFPQRAGYDEAQVDAFLDAVVVYLLSQR